MSPDKQQILYDKYPEIFRERTLSIRESCMPWGIETGDGWLALLDALCAAIQKPYSGSCFAVDDGSKDIFNYEFPQVVASQVKSKYATLRFYYHLEPDASFKEQAARYPKTAGKLLFSFDSYVDGAINMAEILSSRTCEETGRAGELCVRGGYYKTLCPSQMVEEGFTFVKGADQP